MTTGRINQVAIFPVADMSPQPNLLAGKPAISEDESRAQLAKPRPSKAPWCRAKPGLIKLWVQVVNALFTTKHLHHTRFNTRSNLQPSVKLSHDIPSLGAFPTGLNRGRNMLSGPGAIKMLAINLLHF